MSGNDDDDKPTVVLDLNALKKQKLKQDEDLANIAQDIEFDVLKDGPSNQEVQSEEENEDTGGGEISHLPEGQAKKSGFRVVLFDLQSDFFQKSLAHFPEGYDYQIARSVSELNRFLAFKSQQIIVFNYDSNPKAVNQLTAQIRQKFPMSKTLIMARSISAEKAKIHSKTPSGANGYYQLPLEAKKVESEFKKIFSALKKAV